MTETGPLFCIRGFSTSAGSQKPGLGMEDGFELWGGRMYAAIGMSGAGKTVLNSFFMGCPAFRLAACDVDGQFFSVRLDGSAFASRGGMSRRWRQVRRAGVLLYLPQHLPDGRGFDMSVREYYLQVVLALLRECGTRRTSADVLSVFDRKRDALERLAKSLASKLDKPLNRLSGGERRRVELIARMYALRELPRDRKCLLVLDEPTTGLDVPGVKDYLLALRTCFRECATENVAILVTTHAIHLLRDDDVFDEVVLVRKLEDVRSGDISCWASRPLPVGMMTERWIGPAYGTGEEAWAEFLEAQSHLSQAAFVAERNERMGLSC